MKKLGLLISQGWTLAALLVGCGGGGEASTTPGNAPVAGSSGAASAPTAPFALLTSVPADRAVEVTDRSEIVLQFSSDVSAASADSQSVRLTTRDGDVAATVQTSGRIVRVTPARRLAPKELHTLTLGATLGDRSANHLPQSIEVRFTTAGSNWQQASFARAANCTAWTDGAVLLDDGTLLLSCYNSLSPDTSIQRRDASGQWQAPLSPPGAAAGNIGKPTIRKLSGQRALVTWSLSGLSPLARVYDAASGWSSLIAAPVPLGHAGAMDDYGSLGTDDLLVRSRPLLQGDAPAGATVGSEKVFELLSVTTGVPVASMRSETGRGALPGSSCQFPNGDRLHVHATRSPPIASNLFQWKLQATFVSARSGWSPSTQLDTFPELALTFTPVCAANGVARVFWANQLGTISRYADWNPGQGWQPFSNLSSTNQLVRAARVVSASGGDGTALSTWSDFRQDPNGSESEGTTPVTRYSHVPRLMDASTPMPSWAPVLNLPLYEAGGDHDTQVVDTAFDPASARYVVLGWGGPTGKGKTFFTSYSRTDGWSAPWTLPNGANAQGFVPRMMLFNANRQAVLLGLVNAQTFLAE